MSLRITRQSLLDGSMLEYVRSSAEALPDMCYRTEAEMAALLEKTWSEHDAREDLYVFGYGSLIWNPAFHHSSQVSATLHGWHRRFCLKTYIGRGTPENPGLMLALDHGGACKGVAFRVGAGQALEELGILWQREMYGGSYNARWVRVKTAEGEKRAITFVCNRRHPRYLPEIGDLETARLIATGSGDLGTCREYLENTAQHLAALGMRDSGLERIVRALPKR
jgi:glutathione-specific gamma-glutamylcyclotransferase